MRKHKNKIIAGAIIVIVLAFVFWYGGDAPGLRGWTPPPKETTAIVQNDEMAKEEIAEAEKAITDISVKEENKPQKQDGTPETSAERIAMAEKIAESTQEPVPVEPENAVITDKELTCTLSVRCDTILQKIGWLNNEKVDIVPKDGIIFVEKTVTFYEGESVFNLLLREMKRNNIHLEFENTPIYNSAYIEGIANLYEFDCGELSGWMYKVNGWFPNYGCSRYQLKAGDRVEWVYTCDLGIDVGGYYSANGNRRGE